MGVTCNIQAKSNSQKKQNNFLIMIIVLIYPEEILNKKKWQGINSVSFQIKLQPRH